MFYDGRLEALLKCDKNQLHVLKLVTLFHLDALFFIWFSAFHSVVLTREPAK